MEGMKAKNFLTTSTYHPYFLIDKPQVTACTDCIQLIFMYTTRKQSIVNSGLPTVDQ